MFEEKKKKINCVRWKTLNIHRKSLLKSGNHFPLAITTDEFRFIRVIVIFITFAWAITHSNCGKNHHVAQDAVCTNGFWCYFFAFSKMMENDGTSLSTNNNNNDFTLNRSKGNFFCQIIFFFFFSFFFLYIWNDMAYFIHLFYLLYLSGAHNL